MVSPLIGLLTSIDPQRAVRRARSAVIVYALAAIAALCGAGFLIAAGFLYTARHMSPLVACLVFGLGFLLLALICVVVWQLSGPRRSRRREEERAKQLTSLAGAVAVSVLPTLARRAGVRSLVWPLAAMAAYAIYKENAGSDDTKPDED
ncbi:hypothetical protein [Mesorhizobium xinjiangense]|uniref:hypothetical protein n=1 Tax=Mesorhizobium xinjiangense TaxID=2678685 RepID=UPI0012EE48B3|nr:hypothetical protein [Mesorhizobium xinjiangense]